MKNLSLSIFFSALIPGMLTASAAFGQQMYLETDKSAYEYGETIEVHVSVHNNTDSTFTIVVDIGSETGIGINDVSFIRYGTPMEVEYEYEPGVKRTWVWKLSPETQGVPDRDGTQIIYGWVNGSFKNKEREWPFEKDSIVVEAPKYLGGQVSVRFHSDVEESERQALRDSLEAEVIYSSGDSQVWQLEGHSIDSLAEGFSDDPRFHRFYPYREMIFAEEMIISTSVDKEEFPTAYLLHQNYPNPFNPVTQIPFELPENSHVRLEVYDILGRRVAVLVDEFRQQGKHQVTWDATNTNSGVYIYRIRAGDFIQSRQMLLMR